MIIVALQDYRHKCAAKSNIWSKTERQNLSYTYLAHHELESMVIIIMIITLWFCRQLAGQVSTGVRDKIRARLKDDFRALGAEVVFRLLLMSLSGVTVNE